MARMPASVIVEVNARRFAVPYECPCCGAEPDSELAVPLTPTPDRPAAPETAHALGFPYCAKCLAHVARWDAVKNIETGIKVLGLLAAIVLGLTVHWAAGLGTFAVAVAIAVAAGRASRAKVKASCGASCAAPSNAVHYLGWSGNASAFAFDSHVYAARFAEQNTTKLVNINPVLRKVIEGHKLARAAVPTPAAAIRAVPAPATVDDWVERLRSMPGRVARLDWLARSFDAFTDPADRRALIDVATERELAAISERLDQLAPDVKVRALQKAIAETRADNIPEELRDEVVRHLEQRLASAR
jgi:hypothetical protein